VRALASWSGGKDSCLALYKALSQGYEVVSLVNFIREANKRCAFHGIDAELMKLQAKALNIPMFQKEVPDTMEGYKTAFMDAVNHLKQKHNIEGMVFGDIDLEEHKDWVENTCKELEIQAIEPLWKVPTKDAVREFVQKGFKSVIVNIKRDLIDTKWVGKILDLDFIEYLESKGVDSCGENGEFHTFVIDGPLFKERINILEGKIRVFNEDPYNNAFWEILKYESTMQEAKWKE